MLNSNLCEHACFIAVIWPLVLCVAAFKTSAYVQNIVSFDIIQCESLRSTSCLLSFNTQ